MSCETDLYKILGDAKDLLIARAEELEYLKQNFVQECSYSYKTQQKMSELHLNISYGWELYHALKECLVKVRLLEGMTSGKYSMESFNFLFEKEFENEC